jgi:hypothetical protein
VAIGTQPHRQGVARLLDDRPPVSIRLIRPSVFGQRKPRRLTASFPLESPVLGVDLFLVIVNRVLRPQVWGNGENGKRGAACASPDFRHSAPSEAYAGCEATAGKHHFCPAPPDRRPSNALRVLSNSLANVFSLGKAVRYSAASTLLDKPSRAYLATADRWSAHKMSPTGGFSSSWGQCARAFQDKRNLDFSLGRHAVFRPGFLPLPEHCSLAPREQRPLVELSADLAIELPNRSAAA